jgi:choline dehydrogenase-like flavoprotein
MACEFVPDCACCQGYLCPQPCKNDSARVCLDRAVKYHAAVLLDNCEVQRLEATRERITAVHGVRDGKPFTVHGRTVILAAGALATPAILLRSATSIWPDGLANHSGLVGRNLMRHLVDLYAVRPNTREPSDNRRKEFAFNDYYIHQGIKLGAVQSFGRLPPKKIKMMALKLMLERDVILASMIEDLPYADNRVSLAPDGTTRIRYRLPDEAHARVKLQRRLLTNSFRPYPVRLIKQAQSNERIAHACGTCRFGDDPASSVLNRDNRAHDLENLYVVDSSFFPSSGGTNPALTIAANALRVADAILAAWR